MQQTQSVPRLRPWVRATIRLVTGLSALLLVMALALVGVGWTAFGKRPTGERRARMEASPQWSGSGFENPQPLWNDAWGMVSAMGEGSEHTVPDAPLPVLPVERDRFAAPPASGLRVTWLGHSTLLIEIDGKRFLTDPVWGPRASPYSFLGPERWYAPPAELGALPPLDAVLISHDHYDHLDAPTIRQMASWDTRFVVPLGVGAHLAYWGVPEDRIVEMDWWQRYRVGELEVVCAPARHASGRTGVDKDRTLWAGYALLGPEHSAFFSGDTGLFPAMRDIGQRLGPFDVTMIEVGAYNRTWPDWHIGPEQAIRAHQMLRGDVFLPIHWGLFDLAMHSWTEPAERVAVAAEAAGVPFAVPRPGQSIEPASLPPLERWWPEVPWQTAAEHPIVSTGVDP